MDIANLFDSVTIKIAAPDVIRSWSYGEVRKPETLNYRTLKPEKDGLFCEKIFGPSKDWECYCGKYKRIKNKGIVCDRCGVEVTLSRVRRERMGHIELATPVSHIWFFKSLPSRIGTLLDLSLKELERVLYYEEYIVIDPKQTPLKKKQLLNDEEYTESIIKYGADSFYASMGGEAVRKLLEDIDIEKVALEYKKQIKSTKSDTVKQKAIKVLKVIDAFKHSGNKPAWMILTTLPVIPPDLRPLVPLDGGRFATSDLNDLYRRVINRNNRLRKLIELSAPDIIIRNEKRMLQESVDALFENGRHGKPVLAAGNRPLKSLSDMLKGKQGRFRQNLLGKRVDYSGRSVIVIGPELKLNQCGIPKKMALELFEPFIIQKLREKGYVHTIKSARKMVDRRRTEIWDILEEVIKDHPVLLNRAPTLHRLGIQAFEPVLIEGNAIRIHPFVCSAFNADFDGDQMAVHVPLSLEAQIEARLLMLATNNLFAPSNGRPIVTPTQDTVIGCYFLTTPKSDSKGEGKIFADTNEVITAYQDGEIDLQAMCQVRIPSSAGGTELVQTTVGRVLLNERLPKGLSFVNEQMDRKALSSLITRCYKLCGAEETVYLLDELKKIGFEMSTYAGLSISTSSLIIPPKKEQVVKNALKEVRDVESKYKAGVITDGERYNKLIDIWTKTTQEVQDLIFECWDVFNPVRMMADSGARGNRQQIRQLAGMRGLMAKPSGEIIERPIIANFREGLTVLEYFISTHGARKGLADTALKTSDAGYLTRRLVDVAQDVIITEDDCGTLNGILIGAITEGEEVVESLKERVVGRIALDNIVDIITDETIVLAGEEIIDEKAERIEHAGIEKIRIRSVLTCQTRRGVCGKCYGRNLAWQRMVNLGDAVGIMAAQSIGEPGTQLTMRTFHIGGTAFGIAEQSGVRARNSGTVKYHNLKTVSVKGNLFRVINRNGEISINDDVGREFVRYRIPLGAMVFIGDNGKIEKDQELAQWDPYTISIVSEVSGRVQYQDIKLNVTMKEEIDPATGITERVIIEHKGDYYPQLLVKDEKNEVLATYPIPTGAHVVVDNLDNVAAGDIIAKTPRKITKTKDITGGLPRVAELFEARKPKNPAIISDISGIIDFGAAKKGQRRIIVKNPQTNDEREYLIPPGKHILVYKGDNISAGQQITDGPVVLQDILRTLGDRALQEYLVNEIQEVYRLQGVKINDKHIEVIVRQMMRRVSITDPGDSDFQEGMLIDRFRFNEVVEALNKKGKTPPKASPTLLGITKASLTTESFISAASFQETARVLTEAASSGRKDYLFGLKENIIMGHLIPAGTGYPQHHRFTIEKGEDSR
jgi:DNA-directed RNA polymerase subunit beta'